MKHFMTRSMAVASTLSLLGASATLTLAFFGSLFSMTFIKAVSREMWSSGWLDDCSGTSALACDGCGGILVSCPSQLFTATTPPALIKGEIPRGGGAKER